jgi:hypothetical protein
MRQLEERRAVPLQVLAVSGQPLVVSVTLPRFPFAITGSRFATGGTAGSNPAPSSEESVANLTFGGKGAGCRSWSVQTRIERGPDAPYVELRRARYGARTTKVRWMMTPHLRAASSSGPSPIFRKLRNSEIPEIATIDEISFSFKP